MRRFILSFGLAFFGLTAAPGLASAAKGFNNRTISGNYSLRLAGWDMATPNTPVSIIGNFLASRGVLTGGVSINDGGVNCTTSLTNGSSYSVNRDGTGTMTLILDGNATCGKGSLPIGSAVFSFTVVNNGYGVDFGAISTSPAIMVLSGKATFEGKIK